MNLNLKNARRLEQSIDKAISDMQHCGNVEVSIYDEQGEQTIKNSPISTMAHLADLDSLTEARYHIRGLIGTANETCGLNSWMVTECVLKDRLHRLLDVVARSAVLTEQKIAVKIGKLNAKKAGSVDTYSSNKDSIVFDYPLTPENHTDLKREIKDIKKDLNRISDACSGLNLNTMITIDSDIAVDLDSRDLI